MYRPLRRVVVVVVVRWFLRSYDILGNMPATSVEDWNRCFTGTS